MGGVGGGVPRQHPAPNPSLLRDLNDDISVFAIALMNKEFLIGGLGIYR